MRRYKTIVVDPPWDYNTKISEEYRGSMFRKRQDSNYDGHMSLDEIKDFDIVSKLADEECICFIWTTNKFLFACPYILERWGFMVGGVGRTMVWNKLGSCAKVHTSWRSNVEFLVVGKKGKINFKSTNGLNAGFSAKNEGDSIKPAAFYRMIEPCTHKPRLDVFARRRHKGFDAWGNQVEKYPEDLLEADNPKVRVVQFGTGELHIDE